MVLGLVQGCLARFNGYDCVYPISDRVGIRTRSIRVDGKVYNMAGVFFSTRLRLYCWLRLADCNLQSCTKQLENGSQQHPVGTVRNLWGISKRYRDILFTQLEESGPHSTGIHRFHSCQVGLFRCTWNCSFHPHRNTVRFHFPPLRTFKRCMHFPLPHIANVGTEIVPQWLYNFSQDGWRWNLLKSKFLEKPNR